MLIEAIHKHLVKKYKIATFVDGDSPTEGNEIVIEIPQDYISVHVSHTLDNVAVCTESFNDSFLDPADPKFFEQLEEAIDEIIAKAGVSITSAGIPVVGTKTNH